MRAGKTILSGALWLLVMVDVSPLGTPAFPRQGDGAARKFMVIRHERAEMEMARLDTFAEELRGDAALRGYPVVYADRHSPPGRTLRKAYGYPDRLINTRGINPERVGVVEAGRSVDYAVELWLVRGDAPLPIQARPVL
jgi:hypothetical protein